MLEEDQYLAQKQRPTIKTTKWPTSFPWWSWTLVDKTNEPQKNSRELGCRRNDAAPMYL